MDVLITLPKHLIEKILSGEKTIELRKSFPKKLEVGHDGFYVVEKGTKSVRCWCKIYNTAEHIMLPVLLCKYQPKICVSKEYILKYAPPPKHVHFWVIADVVELSGITRDKLGVNKNPQSYAYVLTKRSSVLKLPF